MVELKKNPEFLARLFSIFINHEPFAAKKKSKIGLA
jgi:hypothetical protein